jgi:Flp pilus assembly protein TadG
VPQRSDDRRRPSRGPECDPGLPVRRGRRGRRDERGNVLVETALIAPLLFALLLGIATMGVAVYHRNSVNNAVREAARFGATVPSGACNVSANCSGMTWAGLVQSIAVSRSDGRLTTSNVCVALVSGNGSNPVAIDSSHTTAGGTSPCYVDNSADTGNRVQVSGTTSDGVQFLFFSTTVSGTSKGTAHFDQ